jgi:ubiquinone biosynthesis protein UbiJ
MLHALNTLLAPPVMERLALLLNHVIGAEAVATERLRPHAGRSVELVLDGWPALLPPPPPLAFRVTPAGMLEWCGMGRDAAADLRLRMDASNPALLLSRAMTGERPSVDVEGDAQLAADVSWLMQNLRWDLGADLERMFGPAVAGPLQRFGSAVAAALHGALQQAGEWRDRLRPRR